MMKPGRSALATMTTALALVVAACAGGGGGAAPAPGSNPSTLSSASTAPATSAPPSTTAGRDSLRPDLAVAAAAWDTNWDRSTIDLSELKVGIPAPDPRDLIPPIDTPKFEAPAAAAKWLAGRQPGALVTVGADARFYPLAILTRHEIVNDTVGGTPVAVTYCPLCNTAVAFDRRVGTRTLRFGVSGLLRRSDLVMWDDKTQSLWQQITGEAIVGDLAGSRLKPVATAIVSLADFSSAYPNGLVLSRDTGFPINYGANPYVGYSSQTRPFSFYEGAIDDRYPALSRVVGVSLPSGGKAYPFAVLETHPVVNDVIGGTAITVWWGSPDTADALDSGKIADSRGVGTGIAFFATVDGRTLSFAAGANNTVTDAETGSTWNLLGQAVAGPLKGTSLEIAPHRNEFWFAWQAFFPDAPVYTGG